VYQNSIRLVSGSGGGAAVGIPATTLIDATATSAAVSHIDGAERGG